MLLKDKKAFVTGVVNDRSIAYGIAKAFHQQGARLAFSYASSAIQSRIEPICAELGGDFIVQCDVTSDQEIDACAEQVKKTWGGVDILVHSIAYANRDDLKGRFVDTSREGFKIAMDVSVYSLVALCRAFEPLFSPGASVMTMSYYGSGKVVANYNAMGVAKAALESSVRYLAVDLGRQGVRVNAISAGPVKTMAATAIAGFKTILANIEQKSPLGRNITLDDIGRAALYLGSELSSGTTGEVLFVDSGYNIIGV